LALITRLYENRPIGDNMPSLNLSGIVMKASEHQPRVRQRALPLKLSTAVSLMIGSVIGAVLLLVYALWYMQISNATRDGLKETALAVARTMADMPQVKRGLEAPPQQQIIQPLAQAITRRNDLLYAIVTDMHGIRYSHPDSSIIGKPVYRPGYPAHAAGKRERCH
jgi:two-component system sensor histidine kinase DcuS